MEVTGVVRVGAVGVLSYVFLRVLDEATILEVGALVALVEISVALT